MADDRKKDDLSPFPAIFLGAVAARNLAARGDDRPKRAMDLAESLRRKGASEATIYAETNKVLDASPYAGVSYGADGKPRFELTDHDSRLRPGALDRSGHGLQGEVLTHPKLYDAMPEARYLEVQKGGQGSGGYTGDKVLIGDGHFSKTMLLGRPQAKPTARGVNLHELQHHVQEVEGFAPGGSPRDFERQFPGDKNEALRKGMYKALAGEVEAENTRERANYTAKERRERPPASTAKLKRSEQIVTDQHGAIQEKFGGDLPKGYTVEAQINTRMRQANYTIWHKAGPLSRRKQVGTAYVRDTPNGPQVGRISIADKHQRKGIATALYARIEQDHGNRPVIPDATLSPKAAAFWRKHKPEALVDHVPFGDDGSLMWDAMKSARREVEKRGGRIQEMADDSSGLRGTQNPENLKAIVDNRQADAAPSVTSKSSSVTRGGRKAVSNQGKRSVSVTHAAPVRDAVAGDNVSPELRAMWKAADRLQAVAERTIADAQAVHDQPRLMNTARRARMGSGVMEEQRRRIANAKTAIRIAEALREGTASPELARITSLADVERLHSAYRQAMYANEQKRKANPGSMTSVEPEVSDIRHAKPQAYVSAHFFESDIAKYRTLLAGKGVDKALDRIARKVAAGGDRAWIHTDPKDIEAVEKIASAIKKHVERPRDSWRRESRDARDAHWNANKWLGAVREYQAQQRLGLSEPTSLQTMLRAYADVRVGKSSADPVKVAERALIGTKIPGFFPTPESLAKRMAEIADLKPGMKVLEPSAGTGRLADAAKAKGAEVVAAEVDSRLRDILAKKGHTLVERDFTAMKPEASFDRILMNPPFEKGQDMAHVRAAYEHLKPGGKMVAIMGEGGFFRSDKQATEFRSWLDRVGGTSEKLPEGTFKESNTGVNTRLVVIEKPAAVAEAAMKAVANMPETVHEDVRGVPTQIRPGADGDPFKYKSKWHETVEWDKDGYPGKTTIVHAATLDEYEAKLRAIDEARVAAGQKPRHVWDDKAREAAAKARGVAAPGQAKPKDPRVAAAVERAIARANENAAKPQVSQLLPKAETADAKPAAPVKPLSYDAAIKAARGNYRNLTGDTALAVTAQTMAEAHPGLNPRMVYEGAKAKGLTDSQLRKMGGAALGDLMFAEPAAPAPAATKQTVATLRAEAKAAGIKGVSKMTKAALLKALDKTGAIAMVAAPAVAGLVAFDAARSEAKAAGATESEAKMQGLAQGATAATVAGGVMYAVGKGVGLGVKALAKVAPAAAGPAGIGLALGLTGLAAYKAYQAHGAKGAGLSIIGMDGLMELGKAPQPQAPTHGRLTTEQAEVYAAAAKRYAAMKAAAQSEPEKRPKGWSNAARIAAAKARGAEVPYGGHAEQGPPQWAPSVSATDVAAAMKKAS